MARTNKDFDNKRNELLEKIWNIFLVHGYENTTMSLIINEFGISKGAFYHYFSSKEECADAAIDMQVGKWVNTITEQNTRNFNAIERLKQVMLIGRKFSNNNEQNDKINSSVNVIFHQKLMAAIVKQFAPIYAEIISQGVEEKIFSVKYPLETAEMVLTLTNFYFDIDLFKWNPETMEVKLKAFEKVLESALGAQKNIFNFINELSEEAEK